MTRVTNVLIWKFPTVLRLASLEPEAFGKVDIMNDIIKNQCSFGGKILRVDLTTGHISTQLTMDYGGRWLGGRAVNSWILLNELPPEVKWSDPENIICFGVGVLAGTLTPGACRVSVDTKNVFTGGAGSANVGGFFGAELKFAGFDHIIIKGKAKTPKYLWISDGLVEIRDASNIWGLTTWDAEKNIRREHGDERIRVALIGPAAERLVRPSCIIFDSGCAAGGSGCGAVMGSKNLKAIAVRGSNGVRIAKPEAFMTAVDNAMRHINEWHSIHEIRKKGFYGALGGLEESTTWDWGYRPVRNAQDDYWDKEKVKKVGSTQLMKYLKGTVSCFSCPNSCKPWLEISDEPYRTQGEGWWNNSSNSFCTKFDNTNLASAIYANHLCNQLGLDTDDAAQTICWAFECYEKGLITVKDTEGLELTWGNYEAMIEMLRKLAYREGFGNFLADGALKAADKLGKDSWKFVIHVKGQDSVDGCRINKGWGFGVAVSPVGGRHLRGSLAGFWMDRGKPVNSYDGVPEDLIEAQKEKTVRDILGICSLVYGVNLEDWVMLAETATGRSLSAEEMFQIGHKANNLEKAFNTIHAGFNRSDDYPCYRYYNEPVRSGPYKGERIDHEQWDRMLDTYYRLHGWDTKTGWQTRKGLEMIGLSDVATLLEKRGRLID
jgi:aldehyde:ferredoxin oxidoreductase